MVHDADVRFPSYICSAKGASALYHIIVEKVDRALAVDGNFLVDFSVHLRGRHQRHLRRDAGRPLHAAERVKIPLRQSRLQRRARNAHLDRPGAESGELVHHVVGHSLHDRDQGDDGRNADDDAEHREKRPHFIRFDILQRHLEALPENSSHESDCLSALQRRCAIHCHAFAHFRPSCTPPCCTWLLQRNALAPLTHDRGGLPHASSSSPPSSRLPSRIRTILLACAAIWRSCVIMMIVLPSSFRS